MTEKKHSKQTQKLLNANIAKNSALPTVCLPQKLMKFSIFTVIFTTTVNTTS